MEFENDVIPNELLRIEREALHLSQEELAEKLDIDNVRTIKRWEKGSPIPRPNHRRALEKFFGKHMRALGWGEENDIPYKYLPYSRNVFFTGRQTILDTLHKNFAVQQHSGRPLIQVLTGLAGIGKTQIVTEYAYRYLQRYHTVFLLHASSRLELFAEFASLATRLDLPQHLEPKQSYAIEAVRAWLKKRKYWLLIFDNVDNPEIIEAALDDLLPSPCMGHVLFTTRLQAVGPILHKIEITPMLEEEAMSFFFQRSKTLPCEDQVSDLAKTQYQQARKIVQRLDALPLALDQAAAYIEETSCSFAEYLDALQTQPRLLLEKRGYYMLSHPEPIAAAWALSFEKITQSNPISAELLALFAFLDPDSIPDDLIIQAGHPLIEPLTTHPTALHDALEELLKYSLVRHVIQTKAYTTHRLVQLLVRTQFDMDTQRLYAERVVQAVNCIFPEVSSWEQCSTYLPQALICADWIAQYQLASPEAAHLLNRTGYYLYKSGKFDEASLFFQRSLTIHEQALGSEHPDTVMSLNNLAELYATQGKYEQAEALFRHALDIGEQKSMQEHPYTAASFNGLAELYTAQGKYEQAEPLFYRALTIREQALGPEHADTAISLNGLAVLYANQGNYTQAITIMVRSLTIKENMLGNGHPEVAESLDNLAAFYHAEGNYEQAEPLYKRAIAIFEKTLGSDHPNTAICLDSLAGLYIDQGKYEQAETFSRLAIAINEKVLGADHSDVARCLTTLALIYLTQTKYEQAERLFHRTLTIYESALGPEHPFTAGSLSYLAEINMKQGNYTQAEAFCQRALVIKEKVLGSQHSSTATSLNILAEIYRAYGDYEQAEALCRRALTIREAVLNPQHLDIAASLTTLANICAARNARVQR